MFWCLGGRTAPEPTKLAESVNWKSVVRKYYMNKGIEECQVVDESQETDVSDK